MNGSRLDPGAYRFTADVLSNGPLQSTEFTVDEEGALRMSDGSEWEFDADATLFEEAGKYLQKEPDLTGENEKKALVFHPDGALGLIPGDDGDGLALELHVHPHAEGEKPYVHLRFGSYVGA